MAGDLGKVEGVWLGLGWGWVGPGLRNGGWTQCPARPLGTFQGTLVPFLLVLPQFPLFEVRLGLGDAQRAGAQQSM